MRFPSDTPILPLEGASPITTTILVDGRRHSRPVRGRKIGQTARFL